MKSMQTKLINNNLLSEALNTFTESSISRGGSDGFMSSAPIREISIIKNINKLAEVYRQNSKEDSSELYFFNAELTEKKRACDLEYCVIIAGKIYNQIIQEENLFLKKMFFWGKK